MNKLLMISSNSHSILHFRMELIEEFLLRKISIIVCAPQDADFDILKEKLRSKKVTLIPININNTSFKIYNDIHLLSEIYTIIKNNQVNSVFLFHMKPVIYGSLIARLLGLRHVYSMITGLGYVFTEEKHVSLVKFILKKILYFALSLNAKVFFQNKEDFHLLCDHKPLGNSSVIINGSGVNLNTFQFTPLPETFSFLFVGRLLRHKGIYEYIDAVRILKRKYPYVSFKVAGGFHSNPSSVSLSDLEDWIQEGIIDYLGEVKDMLPVFQGSSVCVLPSYREGCPRSLLEAMSVGRAVITTDAPGCRDTVDKDENGVLVPVKNVSRLVEAMEGIIKDPSLLKEMGLKSRLLAESKFDVHTINEKILANMKL